MGSGVKIRQNSHGYEIKTAHVTVFFGGVTAQKESLQKTYPDFSLIRVKQVHGDNLVESADPSTDYTVEADAHYSSQKNQALCIITADCVPLFFYDHTTGLIAGVHAGWRGVANGLIMKTAQKLKSLGARPENMQVFIGPHIQKFSFEVGFDVRDQILTSIQHSAQGSSDAFFQNLSDEKSLVDLNAVIDQQLQKTGLRAENVFNLELDTVKNSDFHSYRRDKERSGRQISFICRHSST